MGDRAGGDAIGPEPSGRARTLVVCCIGAEAVQLQPAFDVLSMRGFAIVVVEGPDVRPSTLAEHALRHEADAFYVFALSPESEATALAPLQAILRAVHVPPAQVTAVAIDWRDPMALAEHVQALDSRLAEERPPSQRATDPPISRTIAAAPLAGRRESTGPQRPITLVPTRPRTGPQPVASEARGESGEPPPVVASAGTQSTGPQRTISPPQKRITGSYRAVPKTSDRGAGAQVASSAAPKPTTGRTRTVTPEVQLPVAADASLAATPGAAAIEPTAAAPIAPPPSFPHPQIAAATIAMSSPADVAPEPRSSESAASATRPSRVQLATAALRPLALLGTSASLRALRWVARSRARVLAVAGVTVAAVAIAFVAARPDDASAPRSDAVEVSASVAPVAARPAEPPAAATPQLGAESADSEDVAIEVVVDPAANALADVEPAAKSVAAPAPVASAPARTRLGTHEGIVFAPIPAPKRKFRAAKQMCDDMNAGATVGWRMPTLAELHVLAVARAIESGVYWSDTEADAFGERALVWSEKRTAAMPITKAWGGARALCVRDDAATR